MTRLPVIVGFGGFNPAGRVSFHHSYCRTVIDALGDAPRRRTYRSLATLMGIQTESNDEDTRSYIDDHTLIRKIELFDTEKLPFQQKAKLQPADNNRLIFTLSKRQMPTDLPEGWHVLEEQDGRISIEVLDVTEMFVPDSRPSRVTSGGQLPTGYDPSELYPSRNHPRGLQLAVVGSSDAVMSLGIDWNDIKQHIRPDEVAVFAGSAMGQMDSNSYGGLLQAPYVSKRPTSKQAALGLSEMPADFVNAYVTGTLGATGGAIGACATFLYNVKQGIDEIRYRGKRLAVVGGTEAPITPELVEAYRTMGALAEDSALMALDNSDEPNNRRACRPFSSNAGFTLAEAGVYLVLMDDELALELGAQIHGAVADIFVNADGFKKSIPGPGIGNYVTMGKALGLARAILGEDSVRHRSFVHAHGTGTPQNRVTESHILSEMAKAFGMERWPVAAIKAYLGHTLAPASGDQITSALGTWEHGWIPGIATIDHIADDVYSEGLRISPEHLEINPQEFDSAIVNSKGFGGNNASGVILSPYVTYDMLSKRHGAQAMVDHSKKLDHTRENAMRYDEAAMKEKPVPIYKFGEDVLDGDDVSVTDLHLALTGYAQKVDLDLSNPYSDMK